MLLLHQHIVLDVTDGRAPSRRISRITLRMSVGLDGGVPAVAFAFVQFHRRHEEAEILRRNVGQCVRPVFEHALVDALSLPQVRAVIGGDSAIENVVVAALDHTNGVDLHIAEMLDRRRDRLWPGAKRIRRIEPLGTQPDLPGLGFHQGVGFGRAGHRAAM